MTQRTVPLDQLLQRVAEELSVQAEAVRGLHSLVENRKDADDVQLVEAQSIDTISQHLSELSHLMTALSDGHFDASVPDAVLDAIPLSGLQSRLKGTGDTAVEAGEVDFF